MYDWYTCACSCAQAVAVDHGLHRVAVSEPLRQRNIYKCHSEAVLATEVATHTYSYMYVYVHM